jgi:uncharacterized protein (TIGR03118 family)
LAIALGLGAGCSNSNNTPAVHDAAADVKDAAGDTAADTATNNDAAMDQAQNDGGAGSDGAAGADGAAGSDGAVSLNQKLSVTYVVTDQIGGDGGLDVGLPDAGADGGDGGDAITVDPNLVNPWGLAFNTSGPLWVANNHQGVATVYNTATGEALPLIVTVPTADGGTPPSAPTGLVFNSDPNLFGGDKFIFSSEDGTITGWQTGTAAVLHIDNSPGMAVYKGLTLTSMNGISRIYATDFHNAKVDVFSSVYGKVTLAATAFTDATIPAGFAPFGITSAAGTVWVTYAKQDAMKHDDMAGVGNGYIDVYDFDGKFVKRLISQGALNSPWGMVVAPSDFGLFSGALLVGNFGDGHINAYELSTGTFRGTALTTLGAQLSIDGLWSLVFGIDTAGAPHNRLFFTAGPHMESHGILGHLDVAP